MANYFVSYDLNGPTPTHAQMDSHLKKLGPCVHRVLETVWYVNYRGTAEQLQQYVDNILSQNDSLIVITASNARMRNLLVPSQSLVDCWQK